MKKTILILLAFFLIGIANVQAFNTDYQDNLYIDNQGETVVRYYYNKSIVEIKVPRTKLDFIKLERLYIGWQLSPKHKYFKTIYINIMLIKYWLEPLYY